MSTPTARTMSTNATKSAVTNYRWSSDDEQDRFPVEDPATGAVITIVQGGGPAEVNAAVEAAHLAFEQDWRWRTPAERARFLVECADVLESHADELAELVSRENGKPIIDARSFDIPTLIGEFRFYAGLVDRLPDEVYDEGNLYAKIVREPLGVTGGIIPFNWPPIHTAGKVAPSIAMGNTVVIKPSEQAPPPRCVSSSCSTPCSRPTCSTRCPAGDPGPARRSLPIASYARCR